ncbi:MAG: hypothetical protein DMF76_21020 [Acidobacteria bacterium]|nr:MAG: hypothetical protein DMF76_21020 [Acidobacteriota bacterium]
MPEIFLVNVSNPTLTFIQVTFTTDHLTNGFLTNPIFNENPSLSGNGSVLAFVSNANLAGANDDGGGVGNAEIYVGNFNGTAVSGLRQVTKTKDGVPNPSPTVSPSPNATPAPTPIPDTTSTANIFSRGRRLSRDGNFIAFESLANDPKGNTTNGNFYVGFVYDVSHDSFAQLGPRAFDVALKPGSVVFTSALNFMPDGTFPTADQDNTGLNPIRASQIFLAPLPVISTGPFTRLTSIPTGSVFVGLRGLPSNSRKRMAFSIPATELGGGNPDGSSEVYYHLSPTIATESTATLSLFTGASQLAVPVASPTPTPTGSPTPSPSPNLLWRKRASASRPRAQPCSTPMLLNQSAPRRCRSS